VALASNDRTHGNGRRRSRARISAGRQAQQLAHLHRPASGLCHKFNRYWAQVVVSRDGSRLALRSHGREIEIGRNMSDGQRRELARELKRQLRGAK
jgi:uncharacterized membrane protein